MSDSRKFDFLEVSFSRATTEQRTKMATSLLLDELVRAKVAATNLEESYRILQNVHATFADDLNLGSSLVEQIEVYLRSEYTNLRTLRTLQGETELVSTTELCVDEYLQLDFIEKVKKLFGVMGSLEHLSNLSGLSFQLYPLPPLQECSVLSTKLSVDIQNHFRSLTKEMAAATNANASISSSSTSTTSSTLKTRTAEYKYFVKRFLHSSSFSDISSCVSDILEELLQLCGFERMNRSEHIDLLYAAVTIPGNTSRSTSDQANNDYLQKLRVIVKHFAKTAVCASDKKYLLSAFESAFLQRFGAPRDYLIRLTAIFADHKVGLPIAKLMTGPVLNRLFSMDSGTLASVQTHLHWLLENGLDFYARFPQLILNTTTPLIWCAFDHRKWSFIETFLEYGLNENLYRLPNNPSKDDGTSNDKSACPAATSLEVALLNAETGMQISGSGDIISSSSLTLMQLAINQSKVGRNFANELPTAFIRRGIEKRNARRTKLIEHVASACGPTCIVLLDGSTVSSGLLSPIVALVAAHLI